MMIEEIFGSGRREVLGPARIKQVIEELQMKGDTPQPTPPTEEFFEAFADRDFTFFTVPKNVDVPNFAFMGCSNLNVVDATNDTSVPVGGDFTSYFDAAAQKYLTALAAHGFDSTTLPTLLFTGGAALSENTYEGDTMQFDTPCFFGLKGSGEGVNDIFYSYTLTCVYPSDTIISAYNLSPSDPDYPEYTMVCLGDMSCADSKKDTTSMQENHYQVLLALVGGDETVAGMLEPFVLQIKKNGFTYTTAILAMLTIKALSSGGSVQQFVYNGEGVANVLDILENIDLQEIASTQWSDELIENFKKLEGLWIFANAPEIQLTDCTLLDNFDGLTDPAIFSACVFTTDNAQSGYYRFARYFDEEGKLYVPTFEANKFYRCNSFSESSKRG